MNIRRLVVKKRTYPHPQNEKAKYTTHDTKQYTLSFVISMVAFINRSAEVRYAKSFNIMEGHRLMSFETEG